MTAALLLSVLICPLLFVPGCRAAGQCRSTNNLIAPTWRCPKNPKEGFFVYYKYQNNHVLTSLQVTTTPMVTAPYQKEFNGSCLRPYVNLFGPRDIFATANRTCFRSANCTGAITFITKTTVPINDTKDFPECPTLSFPYTNITYPNQRRYFAVAKVSCVRGFKLHDRPPVVCDHDGKWKMGTTIYSNDRPCIRCFDPPSFPNGRILSAPESLDNATLVCNEGYTLVGGNGVTVYYNESWSSLNGTCEKLCPPWKDVRNGFIQARGTRVNSTALVVCHANHTFAGDAEVTCLEGGKWSEPTGPCEDVRCDQIPIPNGILQVGAGQDLPGDVAFVQCNTGCGVKGIGVLRCSNSGNWTSSDAISWQHKCKARARDDNPTSATTAWIFNSTSIAMIAVVGALALLLCTALLVIVILLRRGKPTQSGGINSVKYETNRNYEETRVINTFDQEARSYDVIPSSRVPEGKPAIRVDLTSPLVDDFNASDTEYSVVGVAEKRMNVYDANRESINFMEDDYVPPGFEMSCRSPVQPVSAAAATPPPGPDMYTMVDLGAKNDKRNDPALFANPGIPDDINGY